jgi:hypothetical protein
LDYNPKEWFAPMNSSSNNVPTYSLINNVEKKSSQPLSDNDKADLITIKLEQHAVALQVLSKYPEAMKDYRLAIGAENNEFV